MSDRIYNCTDAILAPFAVFLAVVTEWPMTPDKALTILLLVMSGIMFGSWAEEQRQRLQHKIDELMEGARQNGRAD